MDWFKLWSVGIFLNPGFRDVEIINRSGKRIISHSFIKKWVRRVFRELNKRKVSSSNQQINLVFVNSLEMKKLNKQFRSKNKPTDVLSFSFLEGFSHPQKELGDLVLCASYIKQMKQGPVRERTAYAVLHGILHLLGFEHETDPKTAEKMYRLQDQIFNKLYK